MTNAFVNLCGGGFGANNFVWIPAAVEKGQGDQLREAFRSLVDPEVELSERVEGFRSSLYEIEEASKAAGGFKPDWNLIRISLAFTAALLGAYDPSRYTFYHQGKLKKSYEEFVSPWPKAQGGELSVHICDFIRRVATALEHQGVPIRDLIDAQSFVYLRAWAAEQDSGDEEETDVAAAATAPTLHLVAKWSLRYGADTAASHREVADAHGEVWWGVVGSAERKKLSDENFVRIKSQLEQGTETNVYLAGPPDEPVFQTGLSDISEDRPSDTELIPSYYPSSLHHSLWLKLRDFHELSHVELMQSLEPSAAPGRTLTLTNQTNPLLVRTRTSPRVWWVNQGESFRRAREGGYLWAPILDKADRGKDHWDALQYAREGDVVLSYADGQVRAVSRVTRTAYSATRPDPEADRDWSNDGRRVEVEYRDLETRLPVSAIPEGRRREEGGPFDRDGGVKQGYFFPLSDAFVNVIRGLSPELGALLPASEEIVTPVVVGTRYEEPDFQTIADAVLEQGMALTRRTIRCYHLSLKSRGF
ncbi:MAG TPA: hypothetical protein VK273_07395, partial [Gaiellaceae bacterium]|nr:hypothetical protein [Gaiellaceae bacterium]